MSSCVDMSTCFALPSIASLELTPRETGNPKIKTPPRVWAAFAMRAQLVTIAFTRATVAGSPPSLWGIPIGCST
eukprot:581319-Pleurochrysis_carterae.AAC.2